MPQMPQPIRFSSSIGWDFLNHFAQKQESATGIFKNMLGALASQNRTASEINATTTSQNIRLDDLTDDINHYGIIPMVEKVAEMDANFNYEPYVFSLRNDNGVQQQVITPQMRQQQYKFTYGDKKSIQNKRNQFQQMQQSLQAIAQTPAGQNIDWDEVFKQMLLMQGYNNPDKYILSDDEKFETAAKQFILQQRIQQFQQQIQMQQQAEQQMLQQMAGMAQGGGQMTQGGMNGQPNQQPTTGGQPQNPYAEQGMAGIDGVQPPMGLQQPLQ
jgi:hypothetical protein